MKKILSLALICLTLVSSVAFAENITETTPTTTIVPSPVDYRSYTGFKIFHNKEIKESKITLQIYHMKMNNKDMFWYFVQYCTSSGMVGGCGAFSSAGWIEGKVVGQNWIIKNGSFDAVLGKQIGHIKTDSMHARLEIE